MFEIFIERSAEKDMRRLSHEVHSRVVAAIQGLAENPRPSGAKKLKGGTNDWRVRVGEYRVLYEIADTIRVVKIYRVRHRSDVYR